MLGESGIYERFGIIEEHGLFGTIQEENIDLFTGNLTLRFKDIHLPGPNNLDLIVWRVYNSKIMEDYRMGTVDPVDFIQYPMDWLGLGWSMHMGRLHVDNQPTPIIEFPDGRSETAYYDYEGSNYWLTKNFNKLVYEDGKYKLYFPNGTSWIFGKLSSICIDPINYKWLYLVTEIINSYGHTIEIDYRDNSPTMKKITDSMGRVVTFIVDDDNSPCPKLSQISVKDAHGGTAVYYYTVDNYTSDWT